MALWGDDMNLEYDTKKISEALDDFFNATGIDMDLLKPDFSPACDRPLHGSRYCRAVQRSPEGCRACRASDRALLEACRDTLSTQMHICHGGLVDVAMPLLHGDHLIGYIIFGRMRPDTDFSALCHRLRQLGMDLTEAESAYCEIPLYNGDRIKSVSHIAALLVKYILLENMLRPGPGDAAERAAAYIRENLSQELSVQAIARGTNISKSVLYTAFHRRFGCTVSDYIRRQRVERSKALLLQTRLSMEEIAQQTGFSSASYYSRAFKEITGISPLRYRKAQPE